MSDDEKTPDATDEDDEPTPDDVEDSTPDDEAPDDEAPDGASDSGDDEPSDASVENDAGDAEPADVPQEIDAPEPSRRKFLERATIGVGAATAAVVAGPALIVIHDPLGEDTVVTAEGFVDVGPVARFEAGAPTEVEIRARKQDAWSNLGVVTIGRAWVTRTDDGFQVFSSVCPHLGCGVSWKPDTEQYHCPCHESYFAPDGDATNGPAKRGLDPLEHRIEDDRLLVKFQRFELDTEARTPLKA